jgi:hypothetical protein
MAFSTWKPMAPFCVSGISASAMRCSLPPPEATIESPSTIDDALALRAVHGHHRVVAVGRRKKVTLPGHESAIRATIGSAALSTATPVPGLTFWTMTRLTTDRSSTVLM